MSNVAKLLVVDDDQMMLDFACLALTSLGYATVTTTDGNAVVRLLEHDQDIEVLIIDLRLGKGPTGVNVARAALALRPDLKVILMSGDPVSLNSAGQTMPPDVMLLPKPYRRRDLAERLSHLL